LIAAIIGFHTGCTAKSVIIATGGYEEIVEFTDTEPGASGDGTALAMHVGAGMVDLEMMLFYPTCLVYPDEVRGTLVQYEGLLGPRYLAGKMLNGLGEEFLPTINERYVPPVRDIMMKAMFREIDEGRRTPHGGVPGASSCSRSCRTRRACSPRGTRALRDAQDALREALIRSIGGAIPAQTLITVAPDVWEEIGRVARLHRCETTLLGLPEPRHPGTVGRLRPSSRASPPPSRSCRRRSAGRSPTYTARRSPWVAGASAANCARGFSRASGARASARSPVCARCPRRRRRARGGTPGARSTRARVGRGARPVHGGTVEGEWAIEAVERLAAEADVIVMSLHRDRRVPRSLTALALETARRSPMPLLLIAQCRSRLPALDAWPLGRRLRGVPR